jgi:hypothetical protein
MRLLKKIEIVGLIFRFGIVRLIFRKYGILPPALPGEAPKPKKNQKKSKKKIINKSKVVQKKNLGGRSARQCIRLFKKATPMLDIPFWHQF